MSVNQPPQNNFYPIYGDYIDIGNVFVKKDDVKKINRSNWRDSSRYNFIAQWKTAQNWTSTKNNRKL